MIPISDESDRGFMYSEIWCVVVRQVPNISKEGNAFICKGEAPQPENQILHN
jgi:hypothetical protein